jgi:CRP/FNR family transcriptional regulator, anaerobic regulatory protein
MSALDHTHGFDLEHVAFFATLDDETRAAVQGAARVMSAASGARIFEIGQRAEAFIILLRGRVRVQLTAENGREITLYKIDAGESCILTTSCLLNAEAYAAEAVCEVDLQAIALSRAVFRDLLGRSTTFRDAVLGAYADRVSDLILTIQNTRFHRLDSRLAALVLERSKDGILVATHQELAAELGSAREVVSRILKRFERIGTVALTRGTIEIKNSNGLKHEAEHV